MTGADTDIVVDGNEHEPTERDGLDRRSTPDDDRAEKPISFDFKLRLGTRESTAALAGRATGELVQLQPIDWDSFTGLRDDDAPREYKTDGDLPSIIVELANQIAGPETLAQAALRMNAAAHGGHSLDDDQDDLDESMFGVQPLSAVLDDPPVEPATFAPPVDFAAPPVPETVVATVDDDPMLSAVVDQILETPEVPAVQVPAARVEPAAVVTPPAPTSAQPEAPVAAAKPVSAVAPAVRAPAQPVPEGPIELPRIVALTPDLPSGEVAQSSHHTPTSTPTSTPVSTSVAAVSAPAPVQMMTGVEAMALAASAAPASATSSAPVFVPAPAPAAPLQLAKIERKPGAERPTKPVDFHALLGQAGLQPPPQKKRKKRHPIRGLLKVVVVLGIIGGGLFFGKKYVLDQRWDSELKPYADAVASARELKWKEPITIETLPLEDYAEKLVLNTYGLEPAEADLGAEYRAMGLVTGDFELDRVGEMAAVRRPVMYDPTDKKIYELADLSKTLRDANLYPAMTMALLDQHYQWSVGLNELGRSARAGRLGIFEGDANVTGQQINDPDVKNEQVIGEQTTNLRESLGLTLEYDFDYATDWIVGPQTAGAALIGHDLQADIEERNSILEVGVSSDAAVLDGMRTLTDVPQRVGDDVDEAGVAYWYYVLAGRLSPPDAWSAAVAWNGDTTGFQSTPDGNCVSASISAIDESGRVRLLTALQQWAAAGPAEATTTVAEIGSERIEVHSCDPGVAAVTKLDRIIQPWGFANFELNAVFTLDHSDTKGRTCAINAIRNFGVLAQHDSGDVAGTQNSLDQILASCSE